MVACCHAGFTKGIVQLISRYCMDTQIERWKKGQTFKGAYRQLTKEYFQKLNDTLIYFEHQIIQQNVQKICQFGQFRYIIELFFGPKFEQNSSIAHKSYIFLLFCLRLFQHMVFHYREKNF